MRGGPVKVRGASGGTLEAWLGGPLGRPPGAWAFVVHGFGAVPASTAPAHLTRALIARGFAVVCLDLTAQGEDFTPSVDGLVAGVEWMRAKLHPPRLLVGAGLAGPLLARVLPRVPEAAALAVLNAPVGAGPLLRALGPEERERGEGALRLGAHRLSLSRALLEDVSEARVAQALGGFEGALLVLHAARDAFVPEAEARGWAAAARRPVSDVVLEGADHYLSREEEALHAAELLGAWAARFVERPAAPPPLPRGVVEVREAGPGRFAQDVRVGSHRLRVDEPVEMGGDDTGPTPYGLLSAALGTCTVMTVRMYARRRGWPLEHVSVLLRHGKLHARDCAECETKEGRLDRIERELVLEGPLDEAQRQTLLAIADRCPVHRTLESEVDVRTRLREREWAEEGIPPGG
ncbi:OsmC family protein [Myxococcaceae bacterium GXIMD 01537]